MDGGFCRRCWATLWAAWCWWPCSNTGQAIFAEEFETGRVDSGFERQSSPRPKFADMGRLGQSAPNTRRKNRPTDRKKTALRLGFPRGGGSRKRYEAGRRQNERRAARVGAHVFSAVCRPAADASAPWAAARARAWAAGQCLRSGLAGLVAVRLDDQGGQPQGSFSLSTTS